MLKTKFKNIKPEFIFVASFFLAIIIGSLLLFLPFSTTHSIKYIDSLFTATSAICVTGLTVLDTGKDFTIIGQIIILFLIQLGGLGIMTFSAVILLFIIQKIPINAKVSIKSSVSHKYFDIKYLLKNIFLITFIIELIGAIFLFFSFYSENFSLLKAIYLSIFHSISAFCNAGFSIFSNSLINFQNNLIINFVIMGLIIAGGIGFTVLMDIKQKNFSLHSKIVILTTSILIIVGAFFIYFIELNNALKNLPFIQKITVSLFQSVTTRTAGFNTIDLNNLKDSSLVIMMILMFIGASPGSCGGGIKTTTFFIFILSIISTIRGTDNINFSNRTIKREFLIKSLAIMLLALTSIICGILALSIFDNTPLNREDFLSYTFEVFSALGTVGLSLGYTKKLTFAGKLVIIILMFFGRVGPLTIVLSLRLKSKKKKIQYAEEEIMIG